MFYFIKASTRPYMYNSSDSVVVVKEGEAATIFCQAKGSPLPFITDWIKVFYSIKLYHQLKLI